MRIRSINLVRAQKVNANVLVNRNDFLKASLQKFADHFHWSLENVSMNRAFLAEGHRSLIHLYRELFAWSTSLQVFSKDFERK
jgi:hypothetical protein